MGGLSKNLTLSTSEARYNLFSVISHTTVFLLRAFYPELVLSVNILNISHHAAGGRDNVSFASFQRRHMIQVDYTMVPPFYRQTKTKNSYIICPTPHS